jgi:hypothetical protein
MFDIGLSQQQIQVIDALSSGASMTTAAAAAGIHRNTIPNWRRNYPLFAEALANAQYDKALHFREQAESYIDLAFQTLHDLLADPKTPPSVRLKAALAIINTASTPPEPKTRVQLDLKTVKVEKPAPEVHQEVHKDAQTTPEPEPDICVNPCSSVANSHPPVHKVAQIRRTGPKVGRNDACPCGSGKKYKRCCIDTTQPVAEAA